MKPKGYRYIGKKNITIPIQMLMVIVSIWWGNRLCISFVIFYSKHILLNKKKSSILKRNILYQINSGNSYKPSPSLLSLF